MATKTKGGGKKFAWPSAPAKKVHSRSWADEQARIKKSKLAKPIVPGSAITEGQLATAADAAVKTQFSDFDRQQQIALAQAQSQQRDFGGAGGFYDQYLAQLAAHAAQTNNIAAQANAAATGMQQGITGLGAADLTQLQGQANQMATQRGMPGTPAGDLTGMASQAAAVRQGLAGALGTQTAQQGAAMQQYAGNLANVVGPGQKLSGQATLARGTTKAQGDITATAGKKGAAKLQYQEEQRASEAKNVLAQQVATGKTAADLEKANLQAKTSIETANIRADTAKETTQARLDASQAKADADAAAKGAKPNEYGVPADQWARWSTSHRRRWMDKYGTGGKGGKGGSGPDWLGQVSQNEGMAQLNPLKGLATAAKAGNPFKQYSAEEMKKWKKQPLSRNAAEAKILKAIGSKVKSPALVRAAVDAIYDKHLSAFTVKQLIAAGFKPSEVASTLGVPTHGQWLSTPAGRAWARTQANTKAYGKGGGNLGKTGHQ